MVRAKIEIASALLAVMCSVGCVTAQEMGNNGDEWATLYRRDIAFTTDRQSYDKPDEITLSMANNAASDIVINLCLSRLERLSNGKWVDANVLMSFDCDLVGHILRPGDERVFTVAYDAPIPVGAYRYSNRVYVENGNDALPYPDSESTGLIVYTKAFRITG